MKAQNHHDLSLESKSNFKCTRLQAIGLVSAGLLSLSLPTISQAEIDISQDLSDLTEAERAWLEDDSTLQAIHINGGQLNWITADKTLNQYGLENRLTLTQNSLKDGWVAFSQCHRNLDAISKIEVQYSAKNTRNLQLESSQLIQAVDIDATGQAAILYGVKSGANVCIKGESKTLSKTEQGYLLKRGPYMRKFFDGYYPMALKETLMWADTQLVLNAQELHSKLGQQYDYSHPQKTLTAQYFFEGRLSPRYFFTLANELN